MQKDFPKGTITINDADMNIVLETLLDFYWGAIIQQNKVPHGNKQDAIESIQILLKSEGARTTVRHLELALQAAAAEGERFQEIADRFNPIINEGHAARNLNFTQSLKVLVAIAQRLTGDPAQVLLFKRSIKKLAKQIKTALPSKILSGVKDILAGIYEDYHDKKLNPTQAAAERQFNTV